MGRPFLENLFERASSSAKWRKSSVRFANGNCVEVAKSADGGIGVRDGKSIVGLIPDLLQVNGACFSAIPSGNSELAWPKKVSYGLL